MLGVDDDTTSLLTVVSVGSLGDPFRISSETSEVVSGSRGCRPYKEPFNLLPHRRFPPKYCSRVLTLSEKGP